MKKRLFVLWLLFCLIFSMAPTTVFATDRTSFAGGTGTEDDPYLIETAEHLFNVRNNLDAHYQMIADISLFLGNAWTPIGSFEQPFRGYFDGNNYTISGLCFFANQSDADYADPVGLFSCLTGTVSSLHLENVSMSGTYSESLGSIAGSNTGGVIRDCTVSVTFSTTGGPVGAIAGNNFGHIENCIASGELNTVVGSTGGIVGSNSGTIQNCENQSSVSNQPLLDADGEFQYGYCCAGGIAGINNGTIQFCSNYGIVTSTARSQARTATLTTIGGGIVGDNTGNITSCKNEGEITGFAFHRTSKYTRTAIGGICGTTTGQIYDCYNLGRIQVASTYTCNGGGIAGENTSDNTTTGLIYRCFNLGSIESSQATQDHRGGLVGEYELDDFGNTLAIKDCMYLNNISRGVGSGDDAGSGFRAEVFRHDYSYYNFDFTSTWYMGDDHALLQNVGCTNCNEDSDHKYKSVITAPTCTEVGYTTYTCSKCGDSYTADYKDALGHEFIDGCCIRCDIKNPFVDVPVDSFYIDPVLWAVENGITNGATDITFDPNGKCLRASVVTFLWRAAGCPEPAISENPFIDVKMTDFFYDAVLWAVSEGITNGTSETTFSPYAECNRAAVVTFLYRALGEPEVISTENPFSDVVTDAWYGPAVLWAVSTGVTNGMSSTSFGVNIVCNRAQVVTFLYRAFM